jgi:asparagine synthase (glutamine-hydrolysing)
MCGIVGLASPDPDDLRLLPVMTSALRHRGPDGEGYLYAEGRTGRHWAFRGPETPPGISLPTLPDQPPPGADVALGHRRLAIIDLGNGGHGPMSCPDGRLWISYNGEVFNYRELREELKSLGHAFHTASDTEVLLAAYAEWGAGALSRLNGMWAFVLYDARRGVLFCARDRFGVKPLHYSFDGGLFACASEIKALLAHPGVPRQPHLPSVSSFLTAGSLDESDQTFFRGIRRVPAGHHLTLDLKSRELRVARWYTLPEDEHSRPGAPEELRALLEDAVRLRLRSDVPVGTCLSGGLDSSSIVALTARLRGEADGRRSFSVAYPADPGLDETAHQDEVVRATGVTPARTTPTAAELVRDLPALVRAQDEPFASAAPYSQWRVMALAREAGVKVLLDGQGADEVLAGYHYHFGPYLAEVKAREGLRAALRQARLAHAVTGRPVGFFLGLLAYHGLPAPRPLRRWVVGRAATHGRVPRRLLDPGLAHGNGLRHLPRATLLAERRANILSTSLPALLRYEDRSSMAFGVEARTPFLDYRLVERALALPAASLIRDGWTKAILREASRGLVPETVRLRRDKLGFATPEQRWLQEIAPQVREWLGPHSRAAALLRPRRLRRWLDRSDAALARRPGLWRLVSVELWLRDLEGR